MPNLKERELLCAGCRVTVNGLFGVRRKFCTDQCKKQYGAKSIAAVRVLHCNGCGEVFHGRYPKRQVFCGLECRKKYGFKPNPKKASIEPCGICETPVEVRVSARKRNKSGKFFCCPEHANQWQGRNKIGGKCETCGKDFLRSPSFIKRGLNKFCSNSCRYKSAEFAEHMSQMVSNQQMQAANKFEKDGYALLDSLNIEYLPQHVICNKFCVDAFIPTLGIVIQFDGDYWHGNRERFKVLSKRQEKRVKLDESQDKYFHKLGFVVVRIWESDFREDVAAVKRKIVHVVELRQKAH